jgi:hypothetical protein
MQDDTPGPTPSRSISEISHLFLTDIRDKQTAGSPRPVRIPPGGSRVPQQQHQQHPPDHDSDVDLTPEEYAQVLGNNPEQQSTDDAHAEVRIPPVTAVIAQHLNGRAQERVRDYARHLAANGQRVGVLEVDSAEIRLSCYERSITPNLADPEPAPVTEHFDPRFMTEALDEMSWDLDRWLLVLPNLRTLEARSLLKEVDHWALLSTCDHDGVVSCYRTLKGLASLHPPRMSLALMETAGEAQAAKLFRKLSSVCLQFLGIELENEPAVRPTRAVAEHLVAHCRPTRDKAQLSASAQWTVIANFLAKAKSQAALAGAQHADAAATEPQSEVSDAPIPIEVETVMPVSPTRQEPLRMPQSTLNAPIAESHADTAEVIDLADDGATDATSLLNAVLAGAKGEVIECPVRPPMCPDARLAVTRQRGLVVLAVARRGLADLRAIAQAFRWTIENRALIAMAVPQLALDPHQHPRLRLLVDHADLSAQILSPMLESKTVTVQAYRKLRWGSKTGLLLDAA